MGLTSYCNRFGADYRRRFMNLFLIKEGLLKNILQHGREVTELRLYTLGTEALINSKKTLFND